MTAMRPDPMEPLDNFSAGSTGEPRREVLRLLRMVRRNWPIIASCALGALALGILFVAVVEPSYRSTVHILLDQSRTGEASESASLSQGSNIDEYIATQVAIFQSDVIIGRVAQSLSLDGEGNLQLEPGPGARLEAIDGSNDAIPVFNALRRAISVYRLDRSFVIEVAANSPDPAVSQFIADTVGSAYIADQTESYAQSLSQAGNWLEERIESLRRQSLEAAEAVEDFRIQSGIRATDGQLISDQQLTGLSNQFVLAEANVARLQSRYDVYNAAIESGDIATLSGLLTSAAEGETTYAGSAAGDYLSATERERAISATFGEDNAQLPAIRAEAERLSGRVLVEARGRLAAYGNELQAARAQLNELEGSMGSAVTRSQSSNLPLVQLRSLEQRANSLQSIYQTYLQRYQETLQRQSLPLNGARAISGAEQASRPVFPNSKIVLAFSLLLGLGLGAAASIGREFFDNSLRTTDDLKRIGLETIGYAPADPATPAARIQSDRLRRALLSSIHPGHGRGPLFVAFVSRKADEGSDRLTVLLAETLADEGYSTAILDLSKGEERGPPARRFGLPWFRHGPAVSLKPSAPKPSLPEPSRTPVPRIAGSFQTLWQMKARTKERSVPDNLSAHDVVMVDLPSLSSAVELATVAETMDVIIIAVEWGRSDADAVREMIGGSLVLQSKIKGAVLTNVDLRRHGRYEARSGLLTH